MKIKNLLIKMLGGYTQEEYHVSEKNRTRAEQKYQALLDSKSTSEHISIVNEYIGKVLKELRRYAKNDLYPLRDGDLWAEKMYNVIENNLFRLAIRYKESESTVPYIIDTTLDNKDEFINIIKKDGSYDELEHVIKNID